MGMAKRSAPAARANYARRAAAVTFATTAVVTPTGLIAELFDSTKSRGQAATMVALTRLTVLSVYSCCHMIHTSLNYQITLASDAGLPQMARVSFIDIHVIGYSYCPVLGSALPTIWHFPFFVAPSSPFVSCICHLLSQM